MYINSFEIRWLNDKRLRVDVDFEETEVRSEQKPKKPPKKRGRPAGKKVVKFCGCKES